MPNNNSYLTGKTMLALATLFFVSSSVVSAQQNGDRMMLQDPTIHEVDGASPAAYGNQMQESNQVMMQNEGDDQALMQQTQDQMMLQDGSGEGSMGMSSQMGQVGQAVQNLLKLEGAAGGLGPQISEIAKAQNQAQEKIQASLDNLQARSGFMRTLLGPDYQALGELKGQYQQNQLRIKTLEELMTQTDNEGDSSELKLAIDAFIKQNIALQEEISTQESRPGIFGWFFRLFNN